jgi:hypothetical protein
MATKSKAKSATTKGARTQSAGKIYMAMYVKTIRSGLKETVSYPKTICPQPECYSIIQMYGGNFDFKIVSTTAEAKTIIDNSSTGMGFIVQIEKGQVA